MAITISELLLFNNVESTDPIVGATQLPYYKKAAFIPGVTYVNGFDEYVEGNQGRGSQILLRTLGKGSVVVANAEDSGAFDYSHQETGDTLRTIPLDIVIKQSEKVYEAVEVARASATGAKKAEIVLQNIMEEIQRQISLKLQNGVNNTTTANQDLPTTKDTLKDLVANEIATKLDIVPDTMLVTRKTYGVLLQLAASGDYVAYHGFDTIHTGVVGQFMGMNVIIDENIDDTLSDYFLYNHNFLSVFPVLNNLSVREALDFDGSYVRGLALLGVDVPDKGLGDGAWALRHIPGTKSE